jgi:hypothetical protein
LLPLNVAEEPASEEPIGTAKMLPDGVIRLHLTATEKNGTIGDALIEVKPTDPRYGEILKHLGGLERGKQKLVPPWKADEKGKEKRKD